MALVGLPKEVVMIIFYVMLFMIMVAYKWYHGIKVVRGPVAEVLSRWGTQVAGLYKQFMKWHSNLQ